MCMLMMKRKQQKAGAAKLLVHNFSWGDRFCPCLRACVMGRCLGIFRGGKSVGYAGDVLIMGILTSNKNESEHRKLVLEDFC
jgi:hypothetical protein